jgi:hypothetical protein
VTSTTSFLQNLLEADYNGEGRGKVPFGLGEGKCDGAEGVGGGHIGALGVLRFARNMG